MTENEIKNAIEVFEKPSKHIKCVHKCENGMEFLTYSQYLVSAFETAVDCLKEIQQYRAIGTVGECREARERQRRKKTCQSYINKYEIIKAKCPSCCCVVTFPFNFCQWCGQKLDWFE